MASKREKQLTELANECARLAWTGRRATGEYAQSRRTLLDLAQSTGRADRLESAALDKLIGNERRAARTLIERATAEEMDGENAPDARRVIRDARMTLQASFQRRAPLEDIQRRRAELLHTLRMWT